MSVQSVNFKVLNGKLGVRAPGGVECMAVVGPCSAGPIATPSRHVRVDDMLSVYASGQAPELAASAIARWKGDVLMTRATASTASTFGSIDVTGVLGASVVTKDASATSDDDYEAGFVVVNPGTVGVTGITYQTTLDNFRTLSPVTALGTATNLTIPNSGGVKFDMTAATLLAGDKVAILAHGPTSSTSDLATALDALKTSTQPWKAAWIAQPVDATYLAIVSTFLDNVENVTGKARKAYCTFRFPTPGETEAAYLAAFNTAIAAITDSRITLCAGAFRQVSARTGRPFVFRRPVIFAIAGLPAALPLGVDMSQRVDATPEGLPGAFLYDASGNPVEHDEMLHPGLSDSRALTLRTHPDKGTVVYVNDPVTLDAPGGDWHLDQFVRIRCAFCDAAKSVLLDELSRALDLNKKTSGVNVAGAPTEGECQRIDTRVLQKVKDVIGGQVTDFEFAMHRDDVVLTTQTLNADGGVLFDGYPKVINFTIAAINPTAS